MNRKIIFRTAAFKRPKDLATFIRIAKKLPDYRSVLIVCSLGPSAHFYEIEQFNKELGSPVELIHDISYQEVAAYLSEAGIYVHTYDPEVSFGMPVSIAEAMAAGCTIVARDVFGAADYVGDAGRLYRDEDEAVALIRGTEGWSDDHWAKADRVSRERAFTHFDDRDILVPLLETWKELGARSVAGGDDQSIVRQFRRWTGLGYKRI
ncbi:MAG: glycosyltransferase [Pararhizobium sp.]